MAIGRFLKGWSDTASCLVVLEWFDRGPKGIVCSWWGVFRRLEREVTNDRTMRYEQDLLIFPETVMNVKVCLNV